MKKIIQTGLISALSVAAPLAAEMKVLAFAGSLREESYNKKLLQDAAEIARASGANVKVIDLKDFPIPFFDEDLEKSAGMPANAKKLRDLMIESDAIIIASPEYNSSVSAVLKNALDWTSRGEKGGYSPEAYKGKRIAIMSTSPGQGGGRRGLVHLRAILENVGAKVIDNQVSVPSAMNYFADGKRPQNPQLKQAMELLVAPVEAAAKEI